MSHRTKNKIKHSRHAMLLAILCAFKPLFTARHWISSEHNIIKSLQESTVIDSLSMHDHLAKQDRKADFQNKVLLITLADGLQGVFKPCTNDSLQDAYAEVAAYKASQFLEINTVPPTVLRSINGVIGSLQLYIPTNLDPLNQEQYTWAYKYINNDELANLKLFYFVFGQWDTGPHNLLLDYDGKQVSIIAIDNSGICNRQHVRYGELPFVRIWYDDTLATNDWQKPFPFQATCIIENTTINAIASLLGPAAPKSLCERLAMRKHLSYCLYHNSLWVQFHAGDKSFEQSFSNKYPSRTIAKLKELNADILRKIFSHVPAQNFVNTDYLNDIIDRKNQLLAHHQ